MWKPSLVSTGIPKVKLECTGFEKISDINYLCIEGLHALRSNYVQVLF